MTIDQNTPQAGSAPDYPYAPAAQPAPSWHPVSPAGVPVAPSSGDAAPPQAPMPTSNPPRRRRRWLTALLAFGVVALLVVGSALVWLLVAGRDAESVDGSASYSQLGAASTPVISGDATAPDWVAVAAAVRSSVVAIAVESPAGSGAGSGVLIDTEGRLLTNHHVVSGAADGAGQITVRLADGRLYAATIVGSDATTDIAVLQLTDPPSDLAPAALGDSDDVAVGEPVMAIGNPLGLDDTVTTGIVSALDRPVTTSEDGTASSAVVTAAIQIDAAINPGNSGGPLFNAQGEVIGINSAIASMSSSTGDSSGSIGLGFAIPVNQAENVATQLIATGEVEHAYLGVTLSDSTATADGITRQGAQVQQVGEGTPAEAAGLQAGDVIVGIDGDAVAGAEALTAFVRQHTAGDTVTLTLVRDGQALDVQATLTTRPVEEGTDSSSGSAEPEEGVVPQLPQAPGRPGDGG